MPVYVTYLFYGAIFLSVLLLVEGLYYFFSRPGGAAAAPNRRLRMLVGGAKREDVMVQLQRERPLPAGDRPRNPVEWFLLLVAQSGVNSTPQRVLVAMVVLAAAAGSALLFATRSETVAIPGGIALGVAIPLMILALGRRGRRKQISQQLPDAIDIVVRSLRAGHPISNSIAMVAREMRDPIATEFGLVVDEMTYGLNLDSALSNLARRVGVSDLRFLVVAVMIQMQVGGNLAEVLNSLSRVIRERSKMRAKVRALSAEGRLSAGILSVLPFLMIGAISLLRPGYYVEVAGDPVFWPVFCIGFFLMALGIVTMYRMVNFRV